MEIITLIFITCTQLQDIETRIQNNPTLTPIQKTELIETIKNQSSCLKR